MIEKNTISSVTSPPYPIQMTDLKRQYERIRPEVDDAIQRVLQSSAFINGPQVHSFSAALAAYTDSAYVIPCANGTDALQIALACLGLGSEDEVVVPAFTYIAVAEAAALLGLKIVFADVDPNTFNLDPKALRAVINERTRAVVPVHLFGQCADMEEISKMANERGLIMVEDNAQAIGAKYFFSDGTSKSAGTMGAFGTTSFFPSKNLGCYGDGGAVFTQYEVLAAAAKAYANHGQVSTRYQHEIVGINSRLDTLQAAVLEVKLRYLDDYVKARQRTAEVYDEGLREIEEIMIPRRSDRSTHVFHQYTVRVKNGLRAELKSFLEKHGVPSAIHYPYPIHLQKAFQYFGYRQGDFPVAEMLANEVLSLPIHTEQTDAELEYIIQMVKKFFTFSTS